MDLTYGMQDLQENSLSYLLWPRSPFFIQEGGRKTDHEDSSRRTKEEVSIERQSVDTDVYHLASSFKDIGSLSRLQNKKCGF